MAGNARAGSKRQAGSKAESLHQRAGMGPQARAGVILSIHNGGEPPAVGHDRLELHVRGFEARTALWNSRGKLETTIDQGRFTRGEPSRRAFGNGRRAYGLVASASDKSGAAWQVGPRDIARQSTASSSAECAVAG